MERRGKKKRKKRGEERKERKKIADKPRLAKIRGNNSTSPEIGGVILNNYK